MVAFEITILGANGGPSEYATQCFILKPARTEDSELIAVDGGGGMHQLRELLAQGQNDNEGYDELVLSFYEHDREPIEFFIDPRLTIQKGLSKSLLQSLKRHGAHFESANTTNKAFKLFQGITDYYITHPHFDHINGLVINSPSIYEQENTKKKTIWGLPHTIDALQKHVFNDLIWPDLTAERSEKLKLRSLNSKEIQKCTIFPWDVIPFKVHHGVGVKTGAPVYSTFYIFRDRKSKDCIIVCGDVEQDRGGCEENLLEEFWLYVAENIPLVHLKGILVECSCPLSSKPEQLYGHLSPIYLINELSNLNTLYNSSRGLSGLNVIVTHVKATPAKRDPRLTILEELRFLAQERNLGDLRISIALEGHTLFL
ncbi:Pde1p [Saccharomyces cerevisiae x Saccharomyces kudriavzevii VIN7]|uniref:Pde1p n=1 Tax=Saccharomyces cerevisiae x Saccharomyces kudriavzevii (strain VIN7) TaxID=1095631 RepID=H0GUG2_SACCK|nr:Pde1p [Saccharomyces cerevisiae x Saccharomyces kudriavzevii VIN7]CAI5267351.1 AIS_HP2_G0016930.mRNA.1.CDS.1 [Saccharomyces cerevisiae]CAI6494636.1 AIS_HP2_G0016930.mRNA.1.CDS.1 [Saccharomyces cerevisiae]